MSERNGIKIFVSSTVYDFETQLTQVFAMLDSMGYDVCMSKTGTLPIDSSLNAFVNCVEAVRDCDVFLSFIRPLLGSGIYKGEEKSVTEQEVDAAIESGMPRFVMADYRVEYAHRFLSMMKMKPEDIPATIDKINEEDGKTDSITLTGGCAKNDGLKEAIEHVLKLKVVNLKTDPQLMGALGAAEYARQKGLAKK